MNKLHIRCTLHMLLVVWITPTVAHSESTPQHNNVPQQTEQQMADSGAAEEPSHASLRLRAAGVKSQVYHWYVDERYLGAAPLVFVDVAYARHQIVCWPLGYRWKRFTLTPPYNPQQSLLIFFRPEDKSPGVEPPERTLTDFDLGESTPPVSTATPSKVPQSKATQEEKTADKSTAAVKSSSPSSELLLRVVGQNIHTTKWFIEGDEVGTGESFVLPRHQEGRARAEVVCWPDGYCPKKAIIDMQARVGIYAFCFLQYDRLHESKLGLLPFGESTINESGDDSRDLRAVSGLTAILPDSTQSIALNLGNPKKLTEVSWFIGPYYLGSGQQLTAIVSNDNRTKLFACIPEGYAKREIAFIPGTTRTRELLFYFNRSDKKQGLNHASDLNLKENERTAGAYSRTMQNL